MNIIVKDKPSFGLKNTDNSIKTIVYLDEHNSFTGKETNLIIQDNEIIISEGKLTHHLKNILPEIINNVRSSKNIIIGNNSGSILLYLN
jgi:hypothetical protein